MHLLLIMVGGCFSLTGSLVSVSVCSIVVIAMVSSWDPISHSMVNQLYFRVIGLFVLAVVICTFCPWTIVHPLIITLVFSMSSLVLQDPSLLDAVEQSQVLYHR